MDKICERFTSLNKALVSPMVPLRDAFSFCVRNTIDPQVYYLPKEEMSVARETAVLRLIDLAISQVNNGFGVPDNGLVDAYTYCLDYMKTLAATEAERIGLGCLYCVVWAAKKGFLLFVPPNLVSHAVIHHYDSLHIAQLLRTFSFSTRALLEFNHPVTSYGIETLYGFELTEAGLWKGIRNSLFLQGKRTNYGFGLSRLGGAARISVCTQTVTLETPHYKLRRTQTDDKYDKYWDKSLVFLWWLSVAPLVFPIRGHNPEEQREYARKLNGHTANCVRRVVNKDDWYRTQHNIYMYDSNVLYIGDRDVSGPSYGMPTDFTKIRYLEGVGDLDQLIHAACEATARNVRSIAESYYAM